MSWQHIRSSHHDAHVFEFEFFKKDRGCLNHPTRWSVIGRVSFVHCAVSFSFHVISKLPASPRSQNLSTNRKIHKIPLISEALHPRQNLGQFPIQRFPCETKRGLELQSPSFVGLKQFVDVSHAEYPPSNLDQNFFTASKHSGILIHYLSLLSQLRLQREQRKG